MTEDDEKLVAELERLDDMTALLERAAECSELCAKLKDAFGLKFYPPTLKPLWGLLPSVTAHILRMKRAAARIRQLSAELEAVTTRQDTIVTGQNDAHVYAYHAAQERVAVPLTTGYMTLSRSMIAQTDPEALRDAIDRRHRARWK